MMKHLPNIISALRIIAAVCLLFCNVTEKLSTRAGPQFCGPQFCGLSLVRKHLKMNFEAGVNTILISPRRTGKTSLVYKAVEQITDPSVKIVMMDIYDCRDEYEFYERFASAVLKGLAAYTSPILYLPFGSIESTVYDDG